MRATGKCGCDDPLTYCEPDCVDTKSDRNHCGRCHRLCGQCEKCQDGRCVPCDRKCETCNITIANLLGECESTCPGPCRTVCRNGTCEEPYPPICVCEAEDDDGSPTAKRVLLPAINAQDTDTSGLKPCGEGDSAQCCVPEQCCGEGDKQQCCAVDRCCGEGADAKCCAPGYACLEASEGGPVCCPPEFVCGDVCCSGGESGCEVCQDGQCVALGDNSECADRPGVCCDGVCQPSCDSCGAGYQQCQLASTSVCCPDGAPCCPGNILKCELSPAGTCCSLGTLECGHLCCEEGTICDSHTDNSGAHYVTCCPDGQSPCAGGCCPVGQNCYPNGPNPESCRERL
jgi:hypothetical protein